jgi:hypothetical protein
LAIKSSDALIDGKAYIYTVGEDDKATVKQSSMTKN